MSVPVTNARLAVKYAQPDGGPLHEVQAGSSLLVPEFPATMTWWAHVSYDRVSHDSHLDFKAWVEDPHGSIVARSWVGVIVLREDYIGTDIPFTDFTVSEPGRYTVRATVNGQDLPAQVIEVKNLQALDR